MQYVFLKPVIHGAHQVGDAEEPSLSGGFLQHYAQALEHRYLAIERQVIGKLANREFRQYGMAYIALAHVSRG